MDEPLHPPMFFTMLFAGGKRGEVLIAIFAAQRAPFWSGSQVSLSVFTESRREAGSPSMTI